MKFVSFATATMAFVLPAFVQSQQSITGDTKFDDPTLPLTDVKCSSLVSMGYTTLSSLPDFPFVGAGYVVTGWDSPECGACWQFYYAASNETINVVLVDSCPNGFVISEEALDALTGGPVSGEIVITATQVDASVCGL